MSEKSDSDTSRVIKNPLLSASVTGLTFEDFPNKPLLLPAAPPVVVAPIQERVAEERQKSVTVGQKPEIDAETLSEINLNATTDDEGNYIDVSEGTAENQYLEVQDRSILAQAATSFSQLPTVASTVLSTFSKVIKASITEENPVKGIKQPEFTEEKLTPYIEAFPFTCRTEARPEVEHPKLYSPSDVLHSTYSKPAPHSLPSGNQNNYRLIAKKKTYAQIPGLSVSPQSIDNCPLLKPVHTNRSLTAELENKSESISNLNAADKVTYKDNGLNSAEYKYEEQNQLYPVLNVLPPVLINASGFDKSSNCDKVGGFFQDNHIEVREKDFLTSDCTLKTVSHSFPTSLPFNQHRIIHAEEDRTCEAKLQKDVSTLKPISAKEILLESESKEVNKQLQLGKSEKASNLHKPPTKQQFGSGGNNFRLQKGTPHYKSPFVNQFPSGIIASDNSEINKISQTPAILFPSSAIKISGSTSSFNKDCRNILADEEEKVQKAKPIALPILLPAQTDYLIQSHDTVAEESISVEKVDFNYPSTEQFIQNQKDDLPGNSTSTETLPEVQTFLQISDNFKLGEVLNNAQQKSLQTSSLNLANYFNNSCGNSVQEGVHPNSSEPLRRFPVSNVAAFVNPSQTKTNNFNKEDTKEKQINTGILTANSPGTVPDPLAFFDSFREHSLNQSDTYINEDYIEDTNRLRIQDFFNNPPNTSDSSSDLNYKLVGSGICDNRLENFLAPSDSRALSPVSNIVEPPLSSCSEFSSEFSPQIVVNLTKTELPDELLENFEMAGILGATSVQSEPYKQVNYHWFYKNIVDTKYIWTPFSHVDSNALEDSFISKNDKIIAVEGGRYDVNILERNRVPVYWSGKSTEVRRCSWFYKGIDSKYIPYEEGTADILEEEYKKASESREWHRKVSIPSGETVVFHGPTVMVHFLQTQSDNDAWASTTQTAMRPRVVKRGVDDFNIELGETSTVDHILFMVHGVGSACDLKFRPLEEVVDEFRSIALQLIQSHYKNSCESGLVTRVEVLPVSWHSQLHSGIDEKLKALTLESIPKLRSFTNDTLLDILFYTSPIFCQNIMNTVCDELNNMYIKYCQRNPAFKGGVSLAGHSLGSLILFDLLCHQKPSDEMEENSENPDKVTQSVRFNPQPSTNLYQPSYTTGLAGTGQPYINYPQLIFQPKKFFALGSPIGMFATIRGIDSLGLEFKFPTCTNFFHIFHPYDPVAYRIEALVNSELSTVRPVLIPHHKGRKRMHLELKETMTRVGADLKQKIVDTFKNTLESVNFLSSKKMDSKEEIEKEVDKQVLEMQLQLEKEAPRSRTNSSSMQSDIDMGEVDLPLGKLNDNRRIDYVLQEAPLEFFNEYLFAFASHVCYWESEDTILFIMKEIYTSLDIQTDSQIPQQSMTIERPNSRDISTEK